MSVKFTDLVANVRATDPGNGFIKPDGTVDVDFLMMAAVQGLGMYVGADGCVHDPRPAPAMHEQMRQRGAHWSGQQPRRRGRR